MTVEGEPRLPPDVQVGLYRIAQEALNNVAKHANARRADIMLRFQRHAQGARVESHIRNDGCGFDAGRVTPEHLGLHIMRERAEAIGADLRVESTIGQGTEVVVVNRPCVHADIAHLAEAREEALL